MNDYYKTLMYAASDGACYDDPDVVKLLGKEIQLFTALIVEACLAECWYDATPKQIADNIRTKFGIPDYGDEPETCPTCGDDWGGTSCGAEDCGWVTGGEEC